jgi:hypothetical protein
MRLSWTTLSRSALLLSLPALVLVTDAAAAAPQNPLAPLAVPRSALGRTAAGLQVELLSGETSNGRAAEDSFDPNDTASTVTAAGRISGYTLIYGDVGFKSLRRGKGLIDLGSSIDLFKTGRQAAAYERKSLLDLRRVRGQNIQGVIVERVSAFAVSGLGPASIGLRVVQRIGTKRIYNTYVDFQVDRLLCEAAVRRADATPAEGLTLAIARELADRIVRYARGSLKAKPVVLPRPLGLSRPLPKSPDLSAMVLRPRDLHPKATIIGQGYIPDDNAIVAYFRQFRLPPGTGVLLARDSVALERSRREASGRMLILRAAFTGPEAASTLVGLFSPSARAVRLDAIRRGLGLGEESFATEASFAAQSRRLRVVLVHVRRGRVVATFVAVGTTEVLTTARIDRYARSLDATLARGLAAKPKLAA